MGELKRESLGEEIKVNPETTKEKLMKMTPQERDDFFKSTDFEEKMDDLLQKYSKVDTFEKLPSEEKLEDPDKLLLFLKIRDLSSGAIAILKNRYDSSSKDMIGYKKDFEEADKFENSLTPEQLKYLQNRQKEEIDLEGFRKAAEDKEAGIPPEVIIKQRSK